MVKSIEIQILERIKKAREGVLFFAESFITYGTQDAVWQALVRLVKAGELEWVATGIYVRPQTDRVIGKVTPGIEVIAKAIARRDKARIVPTGIYALNRLGLSNQVPMNVIYLTDGAARKKIGNRSITFEKATPKNATAALAPLLLPRCYCPGSCPHEPELVTSVFQCSAITRGE